MTTNIDNKQEIKIEQAQPVQVAETAPEIKSEENKANWKAFREQREAERKAREAAEKAAAEERARAEAMKAALEALTNRPVASDNRNQYEEETEEQKIDKRVKQIIAEREAEAEKLRAEREKQEYPQKLQSAYKDFNKVCTTENLDYLEYHYPEVARAYAYMPDGFDKWASIYQAVKRFVPNLDSKTEASRAEKNLQKPAAISSQGLTNSGTGQGIIQKLSDDRKQQNWERMQRTLKGLSN